MYSRDTAWQQVQERGPRYAVYGNLRPGEAQTMYAVTAELAEEIREDFEGRGYYQVKVWPPAGSVDLAKLGRERAEAKRTFDEKTAILRAGVLRALEEGRAEAEVARTAGIDRQTVRTWAGKQEW